jgi:hypothetical protein
MALRRADHQSKESYRLSLIKKLRKLSPMLQKAGGSSQVWEQRGRKKIGCIGYIMSNGRLVVNDELKTVKVYYKLVLEHLCGGLRKTTESLSLRTKIQALNSRIGYRNYSSLFASCCVS